MNSFEWNIKILNILQKEFGFEVFTPGLERTFSLYDQCIKKLSKVQIVTIAGTNGKGQVSYSLAKAIALNDKKVAAWTSPHIISILERFKFYDLRNENEINENLFEDILNELIVKKNDEKLIISFYEALFYIFLRWVSEIELDYLVLEVGLGGRLDAVNHLNSSINVVTSISRDHIEILGNSYKKILFEKLGIVKNGSKLITSFHLNYLIGNTENFIKNKRVKYLNIVPDLDDYFHSNQLIVKAVLNELNLLFYQNKINELVLKGRFEKMVDSNGLIIFNGAHNIDGIRRFLQRECVKKSDSQYLVSFSKRTKDELKVIIKLIAYYLPKKSVTICFFEHPKAENRDIIINIINELNLSEHFRIESNWKVLFFSKSRSPKITIFGSFYFIGEIQKYIISHSN